MLILRTVNSAIFRPGEALSNINLAAWRFLIKQLHQDSHKCRPKPGLGSPQKTSSFQLFYSKMFEV